MNLDLFVLLSCECYRVRVLEEVLEALPGRAAATKSGKCPTLCQIATAVTRPRLPTLINSQPCHCGAAPTTQTDGCCCNTCSIRAANKPSRSCISSSSHFQSGEAFSVIIQLQNSWRFVSSSMQYCKTTEPFMVATAWPWMLPVSCLATESPGTGHTSCCSALAPNEYSVITADQSEASRRVVPFNWVFCAQLSPAMIHAVLSVCDSVKLKPMHQGFCQFNMLSNVPISSK